MFFISLPLYQTSELKRMHSHLVVLKCVGRTLCMALHKISGKLCKIVKYLVPRMHLTLICSKFVDIVMESLLKMMMSSTYLT